jgi:hypothetical protein
LDEVVLHVDALQEFSKMIGGGKARSEQIAALIEAAPDLLKALVDCEARLALLVASGRSKMLDAVATWHARATIKKAKGE